MHRIDGAGATVDNKFTDGDPVGGIPATIVTDDWLNDVQENIMAVLVAAGVSPTKGRAADLLDAIRSSGAGIVGGARNAKMSVATASATATFTASEVVVETALGGQAFKLANFNKTINLASIGAGGMDTGSAPASGFVAIYAIYNPTTGVSALLARNAATLAPEVYGGANMPVGYTASALVSVWPTSASGQFVPAFQLGRSIGFAFYRAIDTTVQVSKFTAVSLASGVPLNAISVGGFTGLAVNGASNPTVSVASTVGGAGAVQATTTPTGQSQVPFRIAINAQTVYWFASVTAGTFISAQLYISSYEF